MSAAVAAAAAAATSYAWSLEQVDIQDPGSDSLGLRLLLALSSSASSSSLRQEQRRGRLLGHEPKGRRGVGPAHPLAIASTKFKDVELVALAPRTRVTCLGVGGAALEFVALPPSTPRVTCRCCQCFHLMHHVLNQ